MSKGNAAANIPSAFVSVPIGFAYGRLQNSTGAFVVGFFAVASVGQAAAPEFVLQVHVRCFTHALSLLVTTCTEYTVLCVLKRLLYAR